MQEVTRVAGVVRRLSENGWSRVMAGGEPLPSWKLVEEFQREYRRARAHHNPYGDAACKLLLDKVDVLFPAEVAEQVERSLRRRRGKTRNSALLTLILLELKQRGYTKREHQIPKEVMLGIESLKRGDVTSLKGEALRLFAMLSGEEKPNREKQSTMAAKKPKSKKRSKKDEDEEVEDEEDLEDEEEDEEEDDDEDEEDEDEDDEDEEEEAPRRKSKSKAKGKAAKGKKAKGDVVPGTNRPLTARSFMCQLIADNEGLTDEQILARTLKKFPKSGYELSRVTRLRYKINNGMIGWIGQPKRPIKKHGADEDEKPKKRKVKIRKKKK